MSPLLPRKGAVPVGDPFTYRLVFRVWCLCIVSWWWSESVRACPAVQQGAQLDAASKARLAPLVFQGRLLEVDTQKPQVRATFRVQKIYKTDKMTSVDQKTVIVVEFSTGRVPAKHGPLCYGAHVDPKELKTQKRYLIFAAMWQRKFVAVARPEPHTKRRALTKIFCDDCETPVVKDVGDVRVELRSRLRLKCEFSGNPPPRISWHKNGVKLTHSGRIRVRSKKRYSRLAIRKVNLMDAGHYECKATSALGSASGFARVVVTGTGGKRPNMPQPTNDSTLWPLQGLPCPMTSYCLNGGNCSLYETVGEYVCECAEGYGGRRCESKIISTLSNAPQSPHDLDATTRMLQHYWGK